MNGNAQIHASVKPLLPSRAQYTSSIVVQISFNRFRFGSLLFRVVDQPNAMPANAASQIAE